MKVFIIKINQLWRVTDQKILQSQTSCQHPKRFRNKWIETCQCGQGYKAMSKAMGLHQTTERAIIHKWKTWNRGEPSSERPGIQPRRIQEVTKQPRTKSWDSLASVKVRHKGEVTKYKYFVLYCTKVELSDICALLEYFLLFLITL